MSRVKSFFRSLFQVFKYIYIVFKTIISIIPILFKGFFFILKIFQKIFETFGNRLKKLLRFSLTFKITFGYGVIISIMMFLFSASILLGFRYFLISEAHKDLKKNSNIIISHILENNRIPNNEIEKISMYQDLVITVFDENKKVIYSTEDDHKKISFFEGSSSPLTMYRTSEDSLGLNTPIYLSDNRTIFLQLTKELNAENSYVVILFSILVIVNTIGIIIIVLMGFKLSKRMLSPINEMTETAKAINVQNLDTRLDVSGSYDELRDLAVTFNEMFDRLQSSYEKQNQFVSDASHELRTPISVIQGYVNLLDRWGKGDKDVLDESIVAIKDESEGMKDLIEKLLFLARSEKNLLKLQIEEFYINELVDEIAYETQLIDSNHKIIGEVNENIQINGDRKLLKQAMRIFIDNSVKFTPPGNTIKIGSYPQKRKLMIIIEDTGIGIPKEDIPFIFNRFYRSDKSRTKDSGGHGLGLSIAKWIVDSHRGYIKVESTVGVGTKIKIFLPYSKKL